MTTIVLKGQGDGTVVTIDGVEQHRVVDVYLMPRQRKVVIAQHTGDVKDGRLVITEQTCSGNTITINVGE
jgi:hypothetical protein